MMIRIWMIMNIYDEDEEKVPSSDVPPTDVNLTTWMRFVCHSVW